ncbi:putative aconitase [Xylogone sp. PMI_703]|nr:putative aconitase [Xylogone sp. PMI_703]
MPFSSRPLLVRGKWLNQQHLAGSYGQRVRRLATVSQNTNAPTLSRFETDRYIDYGKLDKNIHIAREELRRPLTYAEKVIYGHLDKPEIAGNIVRGQSYVKVRPSRVALQDVSGQMALLQFMTANLNTVTTPTTLHCDHLIIGSKGHSVDLPKSVNDSKEVFNFLRDACSKYGIGYWKPGSGIIHQVVLENYAYPGGLMLGTDSHTPNAGGLGMGAIGVGGADAVDVMAGLAWELKAPKIIGVHLTGKLSDWASPKDVILKLVGELTVKGATGAILEYFGPGVESISCTGQATICNMGTESGATTSIFPYNESMGKYLEITGRGYLRDSAAQRAHNLRADEGAEYDSVIELDLSTLEPYINGPWTPDLSTANSKFAQVAAEASWPSQLSAGLIGSCTNSSYEDMTRAANLAKQALDAGIKPKIPLYVSVGSEQTQQTLEREGVLEVFEKLGGTLLASACGPCSGSWAREDTKKGTPNSIITSYNRNFTARQDGNPATSAFVASPEMVIAKTIAGDLQFNPITDSLVTPDGGKFSFTPPSGNAIPERYENADSAYTPPPPEAERSSRTVVLPEYSERLQRLVPFKPWNGKDYAELPILIKVKGKCTTDHISPGGPWFRFRGHLENISNGTLIGAINAENDKANLVRNVFTGEYEGVPDVAKDYKSRGVQWVVIADHNYGEGSSREHAALQPRFLNGVAVIAKSFPRLHEANLKKQGMLPLTFVDEADYDRINPSDRISLIGLDRLGPGTNVKMVVKGEDGNQWESELTHSFNEEQVEFFKAGSALNFMGLKATGSSELSL